MDYIQGGDLFDRIVKRCAPHLPRAAAGDLRWRLAGSGLPSLLRARSWSRSLALSIICICAASCTGDSSTACCTLLESSASSNGAARCSDLKPENIMRREGDDTDIVIGDFGLSKCDFDGNTDLLSKATRV